MSDIENALAWADHKKAAIVPAHTLAAEVRRLRAELAKLTAEAGRMRAWFRKAKDEYLKDGNLSGRLQREADEWSALSPEPEKPAPDGEGMKV